jgi:hypothetical protein
MGNGVYAALTRSLKQKLSDLAAVLETDKDGGKAPTIAAAWLDEILDGTELDAGKDFARPSSACAAPRRREPKLPSLLQASLRPYQEDGYQWAMRLATAGMGGCLADDMGLGKTLQALAVLLERAAGGPALVIAPTSVCGNWLAETRRFAPTLNARIYSEAGDSEREELVSQAGPQDLLIVSYTLLQLAQERFAGRNWHTLIADEAQAIKNAAAKRSQAVFELGRFSPGADRNAGGKPPRRPLVDHALCQPRPARHRPTASTSASPGRSNATATARRSMSSSAWSAPSSCGEPRPKCCRTAATHRADPDGQPGSGRSRTLRSPAPRGRERDRRDARHAPGSAGALQHPRATDAPAPRRLRPAPVQPGVRHQPAPRCRPSPNWRRRTDRQRPQGAGLQPVRRLPAASCANRSTRRNPLSVPRRRHPAAERSRRVAAFQAGEGDLFLISLKAGGFGLNLTAADYVVITDPWWNPAAEDQAMGRAHRIGQLRPVTVYRLVTKGTVEERIVDLHHEKRALAESILAEGEASALPSTEDLVALIRGE